MAVPVLMYGSENWSLNRSDKRKIEGTEMLFLRPLAGYTLWDEKRSSNIREQSGIFNINEKLMQYKIINLLFYLFFSTVPSNTCVFLSCRPSVVNTTFSTGLVGVGSFFCLLAWAVDSWSLNH